MKPIATTAKITTAKPPRRRCSWPPSNALHKPIPAGKNNDGQKPTLKGKGERGRRSPSPSVYLGQKLDDEP